MTSLTDQQRQAVETIDRHVLVCAGAGSGKTHVLIERFVEILKKNPQVSVAHLVAVTFTRKAATEMRNRLKAKFKALIDQGNTDAEKTDATGENERWLTCLGQVDGARIGTIHSLCEFIIKSFPVEAGIDPQFEVLDELGQAELLSESIDQTFREVIAGVGAEQILFEDFDLDMIRQLVAQGIQGSSRFYESLKNFPLDDDDALARHIEKNILRARRICLNLLLNSGEWRQNVALVQAATLPVGNKLEAFRKEFVESAHLIQSSSEASCEDGFDGVTSAWGALCTIAWQSPRTTGGPDGKPLRDLMKTVRELCKGFAEKISPSLVASDQEGLRCIRALVGLIKRTIDVYAERKRADLLLDFNDLIALAFSALKAENSAALRFFSENTHTLLVDEFQDTNAVQSDLLALIAGEKAKFFLIGDDKQSIYRFQGADVATFNNWRHRFDGSEEGLTLSLSDSFRSHPELVAFVNIVFASLMTGDLARESHRAVFERLTAARTDISQGHVEMVVLQPEFDFGPSDPDAPRRLEAQAVCDWIENKIEERCLIFDKHQSVERPAVLGDFAVLVPRNSDFAYFERAMSDRSMPYVVVSGKGYLERQEILDLENLMRFLASPRDNHALVSALRSPMFAVPDDLLHKVAVEGGTHTDDSIWRKLRNFEARALGLERAVGLLERFILQSKLLPLSALLRTIIVETGYDLILLSVPNGLQRSRNLWKLVAIAAENEHSSCGEFAEMLSRMREVGVKLSDAPTDDTNAVKLMTIHASKGLEFPFVALPVLSARNAMKKDRFLFHKEFGLAFNTARTEEDQIPTWVQACKILDEDMELAEKKRLFYVAMTRARDHLALIVQSDGGEKHTFKSWLLESLNIEPEELYAAGSTRVLKRGEDRASIIIQQYSPKVIEENQLQRPPGTETEARELLLRLHQMAQSDDVRSLPDQVEPGQSADNSKTATDQADSPKILDRLPQINDIQAGVAVIADQSGQMKFLFAQDESPLSGEPCAQSTGSTSDERLDARAASREVAESLERLPQQLIESTSSAAEASQWTIDLIEPLPQNKLALPSSWPGCERITAVGDRPVFSATLLGTFFHSLMENIPADGRPMTQSEVEAIAFAQPGVIPLPVNLKALVQHGMDLLQKFYESSFFELFHRAKRRLHELPYLYNTTDGVMHSRRPDLILELNNGQWLLVDYKTDHFQQAELVRHSKEHGEQLKTYVVELDELLRLKLKAHIYYAQYGLLQECL